jgi:hydrogenase small subunit
MQINRRDFVRYCSASAAALGLSATELGALEEAMANPAAPTVLWLEGAGCSGCSVSLLNRISPTGPTTAGDLLINSVNLAYHPTLMSASGELAVAAANRAYTAGGYVLVVEGAVPTKFGGETCVAWTYTDSSGVVREETFQAAVKRLASRAAAIVSVGNCASFGGMSAAPPNPTGAVSVATATGKPTINVAGCPPHPDWMIWTFVQILTGKFVATDTKGRPTGVFSRTVHSRCPRREKDETGQFGRDGYCLEELGCRGPETVAPCPVTFWNNGVSWCVGANAPCIGCTEPSFPVSPLMGGEGDDD